MSLNHYERQIYQLLSEADKFYARDPDGKKISVFTDKDNYDRAVKGGYDAVDSDEAEAELSGQTGEKPAEKPEPKVTAIAADPFADKDREEPKGDEAPQLSHTDEQFKKIAAPVQDRILRDVMRNYDGDFDKWIWIHQYSLPEKIEDGLNNLVSMSNEEEVEKFKEKAFAEIKQYVKDQGYEQRDDDEDEYEDYGDDEAEFSSISKSEPKTQKPEYEDPTQGIEAEKDALVDLFNRRIKEPEDVQAHDEIQSTLMDIFQDDSLVTTMMETPPEEFKNADDFIDNLKSTAAEVAADMADESKQPFKEQYNRLFESLGRI